MSLPQYRPSSPSKTRKSIASAVKTTSTYASVHKNQFTWLVGICLTWVLLMLVLYVFILPRGLHWCAETGNVFVAVILRSFASSDIMYEEVWDRHDGAYVTPLVAAVQHNQLEFVNFLLSNGVSPAGYQFKQFKFANELDRESQHVTHTMDESLKTPLMVAIEKSNLGSIMALVAAGADVNVPSRLFASASLTPLAEAIILKQVKSVELLLKAKADPDQVSHLEEKWNVSPLYFAVEAGVPRLVEILLAFGAKVDTQTRDADFVLSTPLQRSLEIYGENSNNGSNENDVGVDRRIISSLLIYAGASVDLCAYEAVRPGNEKLAYRLLEAGANVNNLMLAAVEKSNSPLALDLLLNKGADVNYQGKDGHRFTALHYASINGDAPLVKELVSNLKAPMFAETDRGRTPLHFAASLSRSDVLRIMIAVAEASGDALAKKLYNAVDVAGLTALLVAVEFGRYENAALLIDTGKVDIEAKNGDGQNIAHLLSMLASEVHVLGPTVVMERLIPALTKAGTDSRQTLSRLQQFLGHVDNKGDTPIALAIKRKKYLYAQMLHSTYRAPATPSEAEIIDVNVARFRSELINRAKEDTLSDSIKATEL
jgi:ankyrin repeat protein